MEFEWLFVCIDVILFVILARLIAFGLALLPSKISRARIFSQLILFLPSLCLLSLLIIPLAALQSQLYKNERIETIVKPFNYLNRASVRPDPTQPFIVHFNGTITRAGAKLVEKELSKIADGDSMLMLQSGGGSTEAADRISAALRNHSSGIIVQHHSNVDCASACVNVVASVPDSLRHIEPDAEFMLHAPDIGLMDSYGPLVDWLIRAAKWYDPNFLRHLIKQSLVASALDEVDTLYQRKAADELEGPAIKDGTLQRSIDLCASHPFETVTGITMKWSKIQIIRSGTSPITCPNDL